MLKFVVFLFCTAAIFDNAKAKVIIDNDAGGDDAFAIFLALLYEKHFNGPTLIGLTTANGNTNEDNVCVNNQKILKVAKRQDVPIYRGSKSSVVTTPPTNAYYGHDGLGDNGESVDNLVPAHDMEAVHALIELSKTHEGKLVVVVIGPATNVALAIKMDPDFLGRLQQLYIGAGHIHCDKHPNPEFNALTDVEAYHIVAQHATPDKVTMFPFSTTYAHLNFTREWRETVFGAIDTEIVKAQNKYEKVSLQRTDTWASLDPSVIAAAIKPDLVTEYKYSKNDIILCGDKRGLTTNTLVDKSEANVRIVYKIKTEEYKQFLLDVFSAELK